ncbi:MAG: MBOAT family protein [Thermodesulfovibrionales bacterium]|jgi:D-alanyl-lipoteichoic acid acyltransferase DltB (MBOAT superfamily)
MLFNSYSFLFLFLPVALLGFFKISSYSYRLGAVWLTAASLFFYGWWNPAYLVLLVGSIVFNYSIGVALTRKQERGRQTLSKAILAFGISANLALLTYYKYAGFFLDNLQGVLGSGWEIGKIILPLGISFFTFTQITFLVDAYRGEVREYDFIHYSLFVTYFPHLIAGPILHHKEMMPQFAKTETYKATYKNMAIGLTVLAIGLFKKVVLADSIAPFAQTVFEAASRGQTLTFVEAWVGAISYTLQIYFDFSGYSDMAIGLSSLFGIKLPLNFYSPYQAVNIIEFWRRWHITLSRFLRDYLYIPLGGNRKGSVRRYANLMMTMLLGGLWHGANWTFVVWGALHGLFLFVNNLWRAIRRKLGHDFVQSTWWGRVTARTITFTAVVFAWVFFRAGSIGAAIGVFRGMTGLNGVVLPREWLSHSGSVGKWMSNHGMLFGVTPAITRALNGPFLIVCLMAIVWFLPNTQQMMGKFKPALEVYRYASRNFWRWLLWMPSWQWAIGSALMMTCSIVMLDKVSEFLYFQF